MYVRKFRVKILAFGSYNITSSLYYSTPSSLTVTMRFNNSISRFFRGSSNTYVCAAYNRLFHVFLKRTVLRLIPLSSLAFEFPFVEPCA